MSMKIPKTARQNEVYMSFQAGEGEVRQFTRDNKSYCFVDKCVLGPLETMGHREDFGQMGFARFLPVNHI